MNCPTIKVELAHRSRRHRRGAAAILILTLMFVFVVVAGITVDYAYMQAVRSDLRIATDAAAKAGAEALSRTEDSNQAISAAIEYAAANSVAGQKLKLKSQDVKLGRVERNQVGRWQFQANAQPFNAVQVKPSFNSPLFFGRVLGRKSVTPKQTAIAGYQEFDVCLCLDRSGSMLYDMSGTEYAFPSGNPRLSSFTAWGPIWRNALSPPHPTNSRWAALERVINDFFIEIADCNPAPYTSLVTWGSDYNVPLAPFAQFTSSTLDVALPSTSNPIAQRNLIVNAIKGLGNKQMFGSTNLSAGLDRARLHLTSNQARAFSAKVIILFTDGLWNIGRDPLLAAQDARDAGIIVHTVSMLTPYQPKLAQIAETTGGRNFTTFNEVQLRNAFREIAEGLQVVLVE